MLEVKDVFAPILAGLVAGAVTLFAPHWQHRYWKQQRLFEVRIKVIEEANDFFSRMAFVKASSTSGLVDPEVRIAWESLITRVQVLFGEQASAHFNSTSSMYTAMKAPDAALMFEAKKLRDATLSAMYKVALEKETLGGEIEAGYPTLRGHS